MAKADSKSTTFEASIDDWIPMGEAPGFVATCCPKFSIATAKQLLNDHVGTHAKGVEICNASIRCRNWKLEGVWPDSQPKPHPNNWFFWHPDTAAGERLDSDWKEHSVHWTAPERHLPGCRPDPPTDYRVFLIEFHRGDIIQVLHSLGYMPPEPAPEPKAASPDAGKDPDSVSATGTADSVSASASAVESKIRQADYVRNFLKGPLADAKKKSEFVAKYDEIGKACEAINEIMKNDRRVDAYADPRAMQPYVREVGLYPLRKSGKKHHA